MNTRSARLVVNVLAALIMVSSFAACSSGGGSEPFATCGNGRLDPGEQCDDGNLDDNDDCLSTCVRARCGDSFIDNKGTAREDCDGSNLGGIECTALGFNPGALRCGRDCTFDTSNCPPRPTVAPPSSPTPTPTATPTPFGTQSPPAGCQRLTATVQLVYDRNAVPELVGLVLDLSYPESTVSIPGSGNDDSVLERVSDVSGGNGFASITDQDTNADGLDDQIRNVYATSTNIAPGDFEQVVFDCINGALVPTANNFSCAVSQAVDSQAFAVEGVGCAIRVP